ncbi:HNH endonuclease [Bacillus sp. SCS-151]|uniref:HNH endonuclease n=1 Tax=Nanhaiella sioensis TaxID=3115293 RepID=UPI003978000D
MAEMILTIEIALPSYAQGKNIRSLLPQKLWDKVRKEIFNDNKNRCQICGNESHLEGHEVWEFDIDNCVLHLKDIESLCKLCHSVKHFNNTIINSKNMDYVIEHFMHVNNCSKEEFKKHLREQKENHPRNPHYYFKFPIEQRIKERKKYIAEEKRLEKQIWRFSMDKETPFYDEIKNCVTKQGFILRGNKIEIVLNNYFSH